MEIIIDKLDIIEDIKECIRYYFKCEVCGCISRLRRLGLQWVCRECRWHWTSHWAGYCRELGLHNGLYLHLGRIRLLPGLVQMHRRYPQEIYNYHAHVELCRELFNEFVYAISQKLRHYLDWFTLWGHYVAYVREPMDDHVDIRDAVIALLFEACAPLLFDQTPEMFRHLIE